MRIELALLLCGAVLAREALARPSPSSAADAPPGSVRFRWLVDLGAESLVASPRPASAGGRPLVVSVPGAAYVFMVAADGSLEKRKRLAADPSAPYGVTVTDTSVALVDKEGSVYLWSVSPSGDLSLQWRRELGERATSVGMGSGDSVLVATRRNQLVALSATDGRSLWTADIEGRAEAPAVVDGKDVFVATKAKTLFRIDAATGGVRWKVGLPGVALHPPVVLGGTARLVLCGTWDGQLLAYDPLTGRLRWSVALPAKLAGTPLAGPGLVVAVTADGAVHAYDPPSGQPRWTQAGSSEGPAVLLSRSSGSSVAPRLLVISQRLVALDFDTGTHLAEYPKGAVEDLRRRFADAMLEGVKTYSEGEKHALLEKEAFDLSGAPFGPPRLVGPHLIFGTEEEWAYLFDASTLRPLARYRAGQPCSGLPLLAAGRVLAVVGEEVFGLDSATGRTLWKRTLGAGATPISVGATLGVVAAGRAHALDPANGVLQWSVRGRFRSVAPPESAALGKPPTAPWLADDGEGNLRALWPSGRLGQPQPVAGELLPILPSSEGSWVVATREGKVFGVSWEEPSSGSSGPTPAEGRLVRTWEHSFDERLAEVRLTAGRLAVRAESGSLVGFDEARQEIWRLHLSGEERFEIVPGAASLLISSTAELRVHDWASGEMRFQWKVESPAVGADVRGTSLVWLDRSGHGHRADIPERRLLETTDLGVPLAAATPVPDGFLVTTAAGEVGLVEVTAGGRGAAGTR